MARFASLKHTVDRMRYLSITDLKTYREYLYDATISWSGAGVGMRKIDEAVISANVDMAAMPTGTAVEYMTGSPRFSQHLEPT